MLPLFLRLHLRSGIIGTVQWLPQCNQICMETIGSPGRLVGALAAPGKSLDKGAEGKKCSPSPQPPPWVPPYFHRSLPLCLFRCKLGGLFRERSVAEASASKKNHQHFGSLLSCGRCRGEFINCTDDALF